MTLLALFSLYPSHDLLAMAFQHRRSLEKRLRESAKCLNKNVAAMCVLTSPAASSSPCVFAFGWWSRLGLEISWERESPCGLKMVSGCTVMDVMASNYWLVKLTVPLMCPRKKALWSGLIINHLVSLDKALLIHSLWAGRVGWPVMISEVHIQTKSRRKKVDYMHIYLYI